MMGLGATLVTLMVPNPPGGGKSCMILILEDHNVVHMNIVAIERRDDDNINIVVARKRIWSNVNSFSLPRVVVAGITLRTPARCSEIVRLEQAFVHSGAAYSK